MGLQGILIDSRYAIGSAHGRFQPLHLGHVEYLLGAKQRCRFLWVGITQYTTSSLKVTPEDPHRARPENNPLSYYERASILREALIDARLDAADFAIGPFPIEEPALLHDYLDPSVPVFTTVYDEWNLRKIEVLRSQGYSVVTLWEREVKEYSGVQVRKAIIDGDDSWRKMVPPATQRAVEKLGLQARLRQLARRAGDVR